MHGNVNIKSRELSSRTCCDAQYIARNAGKVTEHRNAM